MRSAVHVVALAAIMASGVTSGIAAGGSAAAQEVQIPTKALPGDDRIVVARIDGDPIHMERMRRALEVYGKDLGNLSPAAYYRTVMDRVIDQELAARAAILEGYDSDPIVQAALAEARANVLASAYLRKVGDAAATEAELRRRYEATAKEGVKQISARHILVRSKDEAVEIIDALDGGADFAYLASEHSIGPSGKNGGDLGFFGRKQMVKPFADAAFELEKGAFTKRPVETQFGWHVILVEDMRTSPSPPFHEAHDELMRQARTEAMIGRLNELRGEAKVERFAPDGSPLE